MREVDYQVDTPVSAPQRNAGTVVVWVLVALATSVLCAALMAQEPEKNSTNKALLAQVQPPPPAANRNFFDGDSSRKPSAWTPPRITGGQGQPEQLELGGRRRELTLLQARRMGLTLSNVRKAREELKASGEIDEAASSAEQVVSVAAKILGQAPPAGGAQAINWDEIDWDAVFALIDRLIQLITLMFG